MAIRLSDLAALALTLAVVSGCGAKDPAGDLPPPEPATPAQLEESAKSVEAGRPKDMLPAPGQGRQ